MYAALFEMTSWMGTEQYIFTGESAMELLGKFDNVQSLNCLVRMGSSQERTKEGKENIAKLAAIVEKHYDGTLTVDELLSLDIKISLGTIKCCTVVEGEEEAVRLRADNPKAR